MRLALIFNHHRQDTTGTYFTRACEALGVAYDHWWLRDASRIPAGYDLYLRIDHGDDYTVNLPETLRPAAFYAIDTHLPQTWRKIQRLAGRFDVVFCAQAKAARQLDDAVWLPVGCDPEFHGAASGTAKVWDVVFVGTEGGVPRKFYLQALRERYSNSFIGTAQFQRLGSLYGRSRIGFNYSIANEINMRVFEILASGVLLVSNSLPSDELTELGLADRRHLVCFRRPGELFGTIDEFLAHDDERRRIAEAGRAVVLERHTYAHRLNRLLQVASERLGIPVTGVGSVKESEPVAPDVVRVRSSARP